MRSADPRQIVPNIALARFPRPLVMAVTAMVILIGAAGCSGSDNHATTSDGGAEPLTITVASPQAEAVGALVLPGRVKAREEVTVTARVGARLTALPIREGDRFNKNTVLARFDAPETQDAVRSARQGLAAAEARLKHAKSDESRMRTLHESRVVAERDLELAELELAAANAALADARAELQRWEESTAITAPFRGVVARRHVDPGLTVAPGDPLLDLRSAEVGEIEAAIPESALPWLESARVSYQTQDGRWLDAQLTRVDGMTDYATRTRVARFAPSNADGLEPGAFARVRLIRADVSDVAPAITVPLTIPAAALVRRGALTGVYVVRDEHVWLRWLRLGEESEGRVEVLAGLSMDEVIAIDPQGLHDGRSVRVDS